MKQRRSFHQCAKKLNSYCAMLPSSDSLRQSFKNNKHVCKYSTFYIQNTNQTANMWWIDEDKYTAICHLIIQNNQSVGQCCVVLLHRVCFFIFHVQCVTARPSITVSPTYTNTAWNDKWYDGRDLGTAGFSLRPQPAAAEHTEICHRNGTHLLHPLCVVFGPHPPSRDPGCVYPKSSLKISLKNPITERLNGDLLNCTGVWSVIPCPSNRWYFKTKEMQLTIMNNLQYAQYNISV